MTKSGKRQPTINNVTTIEWYTLPSDGNKGAAIVLWRASTRDSAQYATDGLGSIGYLLGDKPTRYPVPAIPITVDWTDANLGFVDMFVGLNPCRHFQFGPY